MGTSLLVLKKLVSRLKFFVFTRPFSHGCKFVCMVHKALISRAQRVHWVHMALISRAQGICLISRRSLGLHSP